MNRLQARYQIGRLTNGYPDIFTYPFSVMLAYQSLFFFQGVKNISNIEFLIPGVIAGFSALGGTLFSILNTGARVFLNKEITEVKKNPGKYPLEYAQNIIIKDNRGLEELLAETRIDKVSEWGTVCNSQAENETAIVNHILSPEQARCGGYILGGSLGALIVNLEKAMKDGYNGYHHYHGIPLPPWFNAGSYAISPLDRLTPFNESINLLTFKMPDGPEIIGFNKQHTYIPANDSKTLLVRASPTEIMGYLATKPVS